MRRTARISSTPPRFAANRTLSPETQMMGYGFDPALSEGSLKPPIFLTSTFVFRNAQDGKDFFDSTSVRRQPHVVARDADDGLWIRSRPVRRFAEAPDLPHVHVRLPQCAGRQGFLRLHLGSPPTARCRPRRR